MGGARWTSAGRAPDGVSRPGVSISWRGSAVFGGAKCTLQAAVSHGGGKSLKRTAGGWPLGQGSAGEAVGSLQAFSRRVDTLSVLSPICRVKGCRYSCRTMY
jgi:hypothetical protein